ncbi:MAG: tellurium resistance protein TerC [Planctomycetes bacterium]|nr:tellurium resistance protein TerC [Planctomycetota bacterium]
MLILLQAVLGFDNLLYISMESKRVAPEERQRVRRLGIGIAIVLRIVLLFVLTKAIAYFQGAFLHLDTHAVHFELSGHALIVLAGGGFIVYTAVKEIFHMLAPGELGRDGDDGPRNSFAKAVAMIVVMNLVFSFDSILGAIALTDHFGVMAIAVVVSGLLMMWLADRVSAFLQKNRMYEVLGLFVLLLVGVMLLSEGGHLAHLAFFGHPIEAMSKSTFYFVLAVLVLVDVVQGRYQKKLLAAAERATP